MKIKTKIAIGIGVLVILTLAQGIVCNIFLMKASEASGKILQDNGASIEYTKEMMAAIDQIFEIYIREKNNIKANKSEEALFKSFEKNLLSEKNNITEKGEREIVENLSKMYHDFKKEAMNKNSELNKSNHLLIDHYIKIKEYLVAVLSINMEAINHKNDIAKGMNKKALLYIYIVEVLTVIWILPLLFILPALIANPIEELKEKMREIAKGNFKQKIIVVRNDELGELAEEFNQMAEKIYEYQHKGRRNDLF
ncbi:PAS domain-containing protein [Sporocytophaga myxococcoides]|uniref:histidine kinase n=1 Tax=Sporocytophaga myxococcoides TaxID=153721 RepID=A0A098LI15_9BACT|nr:HAMP domain-containing protein [Sporocytophaga myxococcoides]GAL86636.1 PAS domain-containing protein [Sporocytophaga myxococcoides]